MTFDEIPGVEFYVVKNDRNTIFAKYEVSIDEGATIIKKLVDIKDPEFASFLRLVVIPNLADETTAPKIIQGVTDYIAIYGCSDVIEPKVRTAGKLMDGLVEYALYNHDNEFVQINADGWCIVDEPQHNFRAIDTCAEQVKPVRTAQSLLNLVGKYINAGKKSIILVVVWLVQAFVEGNHSVLLLIAGMGSGKSFLTKILRKIIDPSKMNVTMLNSSGDNLLTALTNSYLLALDNTSALAPEESNVLFIAVTGGTYAKRQAYTTNTSVTYQLHNTLILNGIDVIPEQSDFAQRCMMVKLSRLDETKRKSETKMLEQFEADLPEILGGIFDVLVKAMSIVKDIKIEKKPRMLDAYIEMVAIAVALGVSQEEFEIIYFKNIEMMDKARSNNDLVYAVREYMDTVTSRSIEGTVSEIFAKIYHSYSGNKNSLPKSASQFSRKINAEHAAFLAAGFTINLDDTFADGTHVKIIKR